MKLLAQKVARRCFARMCENSKEAGFMDFFKKDTGYSDMSELLDDLREPRNLKKQVEKHAPQVDLNRREFQELEDCIIDRLVKSTQSGRIEFNKPNPAKKFAAEALREFSRVVRDKDYDALVEPVYWYMRQLGMTAVPALKNLKGR